MRLVAGGALVALSLVSTSAIAQPKYGPGASATEIKVGQTIAAVTPAIGQLRNPPLTMVASLWSHEHSI